MKKLSRMAGKIVAPLAGAWIEILQMLILPITENGRSPCGSVD